MIFVLPAAIGTFLLVNMLCACVALGIGFGAGVWFFGAKMAKPVQAVKKTPPKLNNDSKRAAERAAMAANRVADLAQNVASDVGDHAAQMQKISADLAGIDRQAAGADTAVFSAMDKILAANSQLQERLAVAEKQLAAQAVEIKTHESEARTDSLTSLSNRRAFDDELKRRLNEWQRKNTPCTLVLLDIDFFKKFNDTHGHQVGDEVLRQVAKVLKVQCRDMDVPCRYGGEEFGIILPNTEAAVACKVAERIRLAIEAASTVCEGKTLKVTISLGLSQFDPSDDVAKLIRRADDALYASKKAGRNCGHWNTGTAHVPITAPEQAPPLPAAAETEDIDTVSENSADERSPSGATFIQMLKRRVTESHRFGLPLSVMCFKVQDFELVSRHYGAATAAQMVDKLSPYVEKSLREMDVLARLENGEFVVMLPGNTQFEAARVAKKIFLAISDCTLKIEDQLVPLQLSHGIAELKHHELAQELLGRARHSVASGVTMPR